MSNVTRVDGSRRSSRFVAAVPAVGAGLVVVAVVGGWIGPDGAPGVFLRAGGDAWIPGSYDPELGLFYIGTAQAKPWVAASRGMTTRQDALYTNSTLALDPRTGRVQWYFQHAARRAAPSSGRCPARTATSGSWPPTSGTDLTLCLHGQRLVSTTYPNSWLWRCHQAPGTPADALVDTAFP